MRGLERFVLTWNLNVSVSWHMERGGAVRVVALGIKPYQPFEHDEHDTQQFANPLTVGTCTITTIVIAETGGDGESVTINGGLFNRRTSGGSLKSSRWNKTDICAGTAARALRVP